MIEVCRLWRCLVILEVTSIYRVRVRVHSVSYLMLFVYIFLIYLPLTYANAFCFHDLSSV